MKRRRTNVGFVITPGEIASRIEALDNAIAVLDGDIRASSARALNKAWRTEWDAFVRRWALERDAYAAWSARLFATRVMPRLEQFQSAYKWWARDYQKRTNTRPDTAAPAQSENMTDALVPDQAWWIAAALGLYWVWSQQRGA